MDIRIRRARRADRPQWLEMRKVLWPYRAAEALAAGMDAILANPEEPVFVAEAADGSLVGMLEVAIHTAAPGCRTDRIGYLEGWYVKEAYRGRGIGRQLVVAGEEWARSHGCAEMASDTDSRFPLSRGAHGALGYEEVKTATYFRKDLTAPSRG